MLPVKSICRCLWPTFLCLFFIRTSILGQANTIEPGKPIPPRTPQLEKADSLVADTLRTEVLQNLERTALYDSLMIRASRNIWTRRLYEIFFVTPSNKASGENDQPRSVKTYFNSYSGMTIRSIRIRKVEPFGTSINDTTLIHEGWLGKGLNTLHINTKNRIIRNNLIFDTGDRIDPMILAENERILRSLPFINDARILVSRAGVDSVDLVVITRDVFSMGFDMMLNDLNEGRIEFFDRNFLGFGHEWENHFLWDGDRNTKTGYEGIYRINNMWGSFIHARLNYYHAFGRKNYGLYMNRNFLTPRTRYAGGLQVRYVHDFIPNDSTGLPEEVDYTYQDYWMGRSFLLNPGNRSRFVMAGRFVSNRMIRRPEITRTSFYKYHTRNMVLGSLTYSRENFFSSRLIYNYGRTEDISYGTLVELTGGLEINEFNTRGYTAIRVAGGKEYPAVGYIATSLSAGGFIREGMFEQSLFQLKASYFSPLLIAGKYRVRNFVHLDYTLGVRRFTDESISISNDYGIRGLSSDSLRGTKRLALNLESVAFTPFTLYGFRFAIFAWTDMALVGSEPHRILPTKWYGGLGLGIRLRNSSLVFDTFQIRFAYYPVIPPDARWSPVTLGRERTLGPFHFGPARPDIITYR